MTLSNERCGLVVFTSAILAALTVFVLGVNGMGPLDDHHFVRTIFQGKDMGFYIAPELGRFFPLTAQEYVVLTKIFGPSSTLLYSFNALKLLLCGFLLYQTLVATKLGNFGILALWLVVIFSLGVANTLYRLSAGELNLLIFMLGFVWSALLASDDGVPQSHLYKGLISFFGIFSFFVALFYKELVFVFGISFAIMEGIRYFRTKARRPPALVYVVALLSIAYIAGYLLWRFKHVTESYADSHAIFFFDVFSGFAHSDPFLIWVVVPITVYRLAVIAREPARHLLYDSLLVSACAYMAAYLSLSMFNWYYLLPAYAFAVCGVAGVVANLKQKWVGSAILAAALIGTINVLPVVISDIVAQKTIANNHYQFVRNLSEWLKFQGRKNVQKRSLVLMGVTSGNGVEIIVSLKTFLVYLGVPEDFIEVKAGSFPDNSSISQLSGDKDQVCYSAIPGDLLIYNPYQQLMMHPPLRTSSSEEIYRSSKGWVLPRWSAAQWITHCVFSRGNCAVSIRDGMRYVGYAAFMVLRQSKNPAPVALMSPKYRIFPTNMPTRMPKKSLQVQTLTIENTGSEVWPADGRLHEGKYVNLAYRWFDDKGRVILEGGRVPFPESIEPGDQVRLAMPVKTPVIPGEYRLVISPVQEGVLWFEMADGNGNGELIEVY